MNKVRFVKDRHGCERGVQLKDGRVVVVCDEHSNLVLRYDVPFNINTGDICEGAPVGGDVVDLNHLLETGQGQDVFCYDKFDVNVKENHGFIARKTFEKILPGILKEFRDNGYNVTEEALRHNYDAWEIDSKSGYRDEENGYHLFTPCGCNPLAFRLTTLHPFSEDWQITYTC